MMKYSLQHVRRQLAVSVVSVGLLVSIVTTPADAVVYSGTPDLPLLASTVAAGGGLLHFSSLKLLTVLTGPHAAAETAKLTRQFGSGEVQNALAVFDFSVGDGIRAAAAQHIALPKPAPPLANARALAIALYAAGLTPSGHWDVGYMLERAMSHSIHHVIMVDIDKKFGATNNGHFHVVLAQIMDDLATTYAHSN
jgi:hypothetical protein